MAIKPEEIKQLEEIAKEIPGNAAEVRRVFIARGGFSLSYATVQKVLLSAGYELGKRGGNRNPIGGKRRDTEKYQGLYHSCNGDPYLAAKRLNCSFQVVRRNWSAMDLEPRVKRYKDSTTYISSHS